MIKYILNKYQDKSIYLYEKGLLGACLGNDKNLVKSLIDKIDNITTTEDKLTRIYEDALYASCEGGDIEIFKMMLKKVESLQPLDEDILYDCFLNACIGGNIEVIKLIINMSQIKNIYIEIGLRYACEEGHTNCIKFIIDNILVNVTSELKINILNENESLKYVCEQGYNEIVKLLVDNGARNLNKYYEYPLHSIQLIELLGLGLDIDKLKNIKGYELLKDIIDTRKNITRESLTNNIINDLISIVNKLCSNIT